MTEMKEKIEKIKEGNLNDPKVKSPPSTTAEVERVEELPNKLKLQQSPKNISTDPNQEMTAVDKQNEPTDQNGKQQPLLSKPKSGKKVEEKSELKCKPMTSQNTSANDSMKDLGVGGKIHQETAKAEESQTDASVEKRESKCAGMTPEKAETLEATKELPTQDETIIGKLLVVTLRNFYSEDLVLLLCYMYNNSWSSAQ